MAIAQAVTLPPLSDPGCVMFYNTLGGSTLLCGVGLVILLLVVHLMVSAKKRTWGWFITFLGIPPVWFSCGTLMAALLVGGGAVTIDELTISVFGALIGVLHLLFGIAVLKLTRGTPRAFPSTEASTR